MAIFNAAQAGAVVKAQDGGIVAFGRLLSATRNSYVWATTGAAHRVFVDGEQIRVGARDLPSAGSAMRLRVDLQGDGDFDVTISALNVPLTALTATPQRFWQTVLAGNDNIIAPLKCSATLFGDALTVSGNTLYIGGRDTFSAGTGAAQNFYGDAYAVGTDPEHGALRGALNGGRDVLTVDNSRGTSLLVGDAGEVNGSASVHGGADVLNGSSTRADILVGDVERVGQGSVIGAGDTLYGRGGNDILIGDVRTVDLFAGSAAVASARGGGDLIRGGDGNDIIVGDMYYVEDAQIGQRNSARGGNDTLHGDNGNDRIYGDTVASNDAFEHFGDDHIYGGAGNDLLYGDAVSFAVGLPADVVIGGNDFIDGGLGDDRIFGGVGADTLAGRDGHDRIDGGYGNDDIAGGRGDDIIIGGAGDDRLYGDKQFPGGADTFQFFADAGHDLIMDFDADADTLEIAASYGFADAAAVVAAATVQVDVVLHLDAHSQVILVGYTAATDTLLEHIVIV